MVKESQHGRWNDPNLSEQDLERRTGLTADELLIAVEELEELGLVERKGALGAGPFGIALRATGRLFAEHDGAFMPWRPSEDAHRVVACLVNGDKKASRLDAIALRLGWSPRRLNPAVTYLMEHGLAHANKETSFPLVVVEIHLEPKASRWLREP
jgi:hypothetical protein